MTSMTHTSIPGEGCESSCPPSFSFSSSPCALSSFASSSSSRCCCSASSSSSAPNSKSSSSLLFPFSSSPASLLASFLRRSSSSSSSSLRRHEERERQQGQKQKQQQEEQQKLQQQQRQQQQQQQQQQQKQQELDQHILLKHASSHRPRNRGCRPRERTETCCKIKHSSNRNSSKSGSCGSSSHKDLPSHFSSHSSSTTTKTNTSPTATTATTATKTTTTASSSKSSTSARSLPSLALLPLLLLPSLLSSLPLALGQATTTLEEDLAPDKKTDPWTTTSRFKRDLVELFPASRGEVALELGAHLGHCTRVLSRLFGSVIAVEHSTAVLDRNVQRNSDLGNVVYLNFHTVMDDWAVFSRSKIGLSFIDAAHDYASVKSDIVRSLQIPTVHTLVLDDYGAERGVKEAVTEAIAEGLVTFRRYIGAEPPWSFSGRTVDEWEGIVLDPVRKGSEVDLRPPPSLIGTTWVVFPAGVFVSGYFQPHGKISFEENHMAASSYGTIAWREALPEESMGMDGIFVLKLEDPPGWRAQLKLNEHRTAAILFRDDGHELVLLREEMMRTVGEKLLSFLH